MCTQVTGVVMTTTYGGQISVSSDGRVVCVMSIRLSLAEEEEEELEDATIEGDPKYNFELNYFGISSDNNVRLTYFSINARECIFIA